MKNHANNIKGVPLADKRQPQHMPIIITISSEFLSYFVSVEGYGDYYERS